MKKKFLWFAFATVATAVAVVGYYAHSQTDGLTPLQIANIESLSDQGPEILVEYDKSCVENGDACIPDYKQVVFNARGQNL